MPLADTMTATERRATLLLASIVSLRMLGLFMIFPVFAIYAEHLADTTPTLVGAAIGIYGLTQAVLQIPFGMLSDRFGRKPIITIGLTIFVIGSIVAASSTSIVGVVIGRALQGGGAIAAAILALAADLTREEHRTKAMALLGMSIGISFILALASGPLLNQWIGVPGIFWLAAGFGIIAISILHVFVPRPISCRFHRDTEPVPTQFLRILQDAQLARLQIGALLLHASLTCVFVVVPIALKEQLVTQQHWQVYVPVLLASVIAMIPFMILAEKYRQLKWVFVGSIVSLGFSQVGLIYLHHSLMGIALMLFIFFTAFTLLEANLPALVSRMAPADSKGTALGIYSSGQFLGIFIGGLLGGWLHHHYSMEAVFGLCAMMTVIWFILAITMQNPTYLSSHLLNVGSINSQQAIQLNQRLSAIRGIAEVVVIVEDGVAYLKIDRKILDMAALDDFSVAEEIRC